MFKKVGNLQKSRECSKSGESSKFPKKLLSFACQRKDVNGCYCCDEEFYLSDRIKRSKQANAKAHSRRDCSADLEMHKLKKNTFCLESKIFAHRTPTARKTFDEFANVKVRLHQVASFHHSFIFSCLRFFAIHEIGKYLTLEVIDGMKRHDIKMFLFTMPRPLTFRNSQPSQLSYVFCFSCAKIFLASLSKKSQIPFGFLFVSITVDSSGKTLMLMISQKACEFEPFLVVNAKKMRASLR